MKYGDLHEDGVECLLMEIHKYQVSPSQVTLEESASQVTAPGHDRFFNNESKTRRGEKNLQNS